MKLCLICFKCLCFEWRGVGSPPIFVLFIPSMIFCLGFQSFATFIFPRLKTSPLSLDSKLDCQQGPEVLPSQGTSILDRWAQLSVPVINSHVREVRELAGKTCNQSKQSCLWCKEHRNITGISRFTCSMEKWNPPFRTAYWPKIYLCL